MRDRSLSIAVVMRRLLLLGLATISACGAPQRPTGPAPEYEPAKVLLWDAGNPSEEQDPFASAAVGDWVGDSQAEEASGESPSADAGVESSVEDATGGAVSEEIEALGSTHRESHGTGATETARQPHSDTPSSGAEGSESLGAGTQASD